MALLKEFFALTEKYQHDYGEKTIFIMQVGSFYEVYGMSDAETGNVTGSKILDFAKICDLCISKRISAEVFKPSGVSNRDEILTAGVPLLQLEKYLNKLQEAGYTIVVYNQDDKEGDAPITRSLFGIFSPGTYFQTDSVALTNSTTCIWVHYVENKVIMKGKYILVGIGNIDIFTGKTAMYQFKEIYINSPTTYDELEKFISIYNPSEVILISNLPHAGELDNIISYAGISCTAIHKIHIDSTANSTHLVKRLQNCEKQLYQKEILSKFYKFDDFNVFIQNFYNNDIATQAFCYLLDFVHQHNPRLVDNIAHPEFENLSHRLTLANHSLKQLNIINDGTVKSSKLSSVSELLNDCLTPMGRRQFMYNITNPICNESELNREYNITDYMLLQFSHINSQLKPKLSHIKDLAKYERQIVLRQLSPDNICHFNNTILLVYDIFQCIKEDTVIMEYFQHHDPNIMHMGQMCNELTEYINATIDISAILAASSSSSSSNKSSDALVHCIRRGVDDKLDNFVNSYNTDISSVEAIRVYLNSLIEIKENKSTRSAEYVKVHPTEKTPVAGLIATVRRCKLLLDVLPSTNTRVTLWRDDAIRSSFEIIVSKSLFSFEKQSGSNNFIIEDTITQYCKNIVVLQTSIKEAAVFIFKQFIENLGITYLPQLEQMCKFIARVDIMLTKASIAKKYNYCKPTIIEADKSCVHTTGLRHCLIEQFQTEELYVTNNVSLGDGRMDGILLYGTNAVGKTTLIRAVGIAVILAQAGLYVPCSSFSFKPYSYIFTRILGNDNIFKGLSTFEVEMSELRTILRLANKNSLILGDEICSGTETISAVSIFIAGIQSLYQLKCSFIFATHLHEIVDYPEISELHTVHMMHMKVVYDKEHDMLIYDRKLKKGSGDNMYGLEVCKSLNMPNDFLEAANNIRLKYHPESKSILSLKSSRYNSHKIVNLCELCGKHPGTEVHHLQFQSDANDNGIIETVDATFHKNNVANLMTLCESCHTNLHKTHTKQKKVKTTKGSKLMPLTSSASASTSSTSAST